MPPVEVILFNVPPTLTTPVEAVVNGAQVEPSAVPSNTAVCVLNLIVPAAPALAAVLPCGKVTPAVPGNTALLANPIVTFPVALDTVV